MSRDLELLVRESLVEDTILIYKGHDELIFLKELKLDPVKVTDAVNKQETAADTAAQLTACTKCPGACQKKYPFGSGKNGLMILLNSPRMLTPTEIRIFREDSIALLKKMVAAMDLQFNECYITNLIKCDTSSQSLQPSEMINHCIEFIASEIKDIAPKTVLVMGDLLPLRDIVHASSGITWYSVHHPVTLIKNPEMKSAAWKTMKLVMESLGAAQ